MDTSKVTILSKRPDPWTINVENVD